MPGSGKSQFQRSFFLLLFFYASAFTVFCLVEKIFFSLDILSGKNLLNWDAMHYDTIRKVGYTTGMVAFFPLFPYLWKWIHLDAAGISILNGIIFIISLSVLAIVFKIRTKYLLLLASTPVLIFMFLPFSEAIFFFTSTLVLAGLKRNNFALLLVGIFFSGLARPVASVFIPSLLILYFYFQDKSILPLRKCIILILTCLLSMVAVFGLQYVQTGDWFAFLHVQKEWGNYLRIPTFPLNSWAGGLIVRLDAMAFFFGVVAACFMCYLLYMRMKKEKDVKVPNTFLFSLCYLGILTLIILFTRGGVLNSLNRYVFCTAFFMIALHEVLQTLHYNKRNLLRIFFGSGIFWLIFASYVHIQTVLKFEFLSIYLVMLFAVLSQNSLLKNTGYILVFACNLVLMMVFLHRFLSGNWVG